jgi:integrase
MHLLFQQYLERLERRQSAASTIKNFRRTSALFDESGLDPMTAEDWEIEKWLTGLQLSPRTRRLHLENLSAAYNYAVHRRMLQQAPTETVRLPREPDKEPRILEGHELRHILGNTMTDQQELLITAMIYTGMRRNEARHLKWEDISPTSIRVIGKGDKLRHIPLHPALAEAIVRQPQPTSPYVFPGRGGNVMAESTFFYILEKCRGSVSCTFHDFRRTVATSLAENDVPEGIIDRIMGWAPRTVGRRYYIRRADRRMQEAILCLYADDPLTVMPSRQQVCEVA